MEVWLQLTALPARTFTPAFPSWLHWTQKGKFEQADPLLLKAIKIQEEAFGTDHPSLAASLGCRAQGLLALSSRESSPFPASEGFDECHTFKSSFRANCELFTIQELCCSISISRFGLDYYGLSDAGRSLEDREVWLEFVAVPARTFLPRAVRHDT